MTKWWKEIVDNQLFVYYCGELVYKRWLWRNKGIIIHKGGP